MLRIWKYRYWFNVGSHNQEKGVQNMRGFVALLAVMLFAGSMIMGCGEGAEVDLTPAQQQQIEEFQREGGPPPPPEQ